MLLSVVLVVQSLVGLPASASSRFTVDHSSPMRASARIDFMVIIPEIIYIGGIGQVADRESRDEAASFNAISSRPGMFPGAANGSTVAMSNAGTLIYGSVSPDTTVSFKPNATPSGGSENIPVSYLVAIP